MAPTDPRSTATSRLATLDWRRRTRRLYDEVRDTAETAGPEAAHALWRAGRDELFATHPASPLLPHHRDGFAGLPVAAYDPAWRLDALVEPAEPGPDGAPVRTEVLTGTDGVVPFDRVGRLTLATPAGEVRLALWWLASYGGGLFLPLRDGTCGAGASHTTPPAFGGGRYVLDTVKGADLGSTRGADGTRLVVDLNFAYNPSCAYDPDWACPLAPPENTTGVPVPVGERYAGPWAEVPDLG